MPIVFKAGEQSKTLGTLAHIYEELANTAFNRSDVIVALGGGVTGDMAGFAASSYLRGIGFIHKLKSKNFRGVAFIHK